MSTILSVYYYSQVYNNEEKLTGPYALYSIMVPLTYAIIYLSCNNSCTMHRELIIYITCTTSSIIYHIDPVDAWTSFSISLCRRPSHFIQRWPQSVTQCKLYCIAIFVQSPRVSDSCVSVNDPTNIISFNSVYYFGKQYSICNITLFRASTINATMQLCHHNSLPSHHISYLYRLIIITSSSVHVTQQANSVT